MRHPYLVVLVANVNHCAFNSTAEVFAVALDIIETVSLNDLSLK